MKGILKKTAMLLALALSASMMTACGSSGSQNGEKVEIRIVTSERSKMDLYQSAADKFNEENDKNIQVVFDFKADNIGELIKTGYTSNNAPDIHGGMGSAMDNLAKKSGWYREVPEETVAAWKEQHGANSVTFTGDKIYSLKTVSTMEGNNGYKFLWNKTLFAEAGLDPETPPKTWAEVREFAKKITEVGAGKKYGYVMPFKDAIFTRYYIIIPGATSGIYNADGFEPTQGKYDFSIYAPMIEVYRQMIADGSVFPSPYTIDNDTARAQFAEGNIGMICAAGWDVDVFNDQFPVKDEWGITEYPVIEEFAGGYPYGVGSGTSYYMSNQSAHPEEQLEVYTWFMTLIEDEEIRAAKKGHEEFSTFKYPIAKSDGAKTPTGILKIEGEDSWTMLKNLILSDGDIKEGLQAISDSYNAALERARQDGENVDSYIHPDYSFYADSEEELAAQAEQLAKEEAASAE
ncbi:MAG: extracellular solute-binding protein [Clostridia bacterium]|nr:extracellular solute-binding protein [Clostridia bacterium]